VWLLFAALLCVIVPLLIRRIVGGGQQGLPELLT
jgi:hypothetical protein